MMSLLVMFLRDRIGSDTVEWLEQGEVSAFSRNECNRRVKIAKLCSRKFGSEIPVGHFFCFKHKWTYKQSFHLAYSSSNQGQFLC